MPYSLYELNKMSKEQLENLANELNIKGAKKMDSESLAFAILDTQAQAESLKTSQEKTTKKRGRPRKDASPAKESNDQIYRGCGFAYTTFLIGNRNYFCHINTYFFILISILT